MSDSSRPDARGGAARVALSLPGGGPSGALYQVGALAAIHDHAGGLDRFALYIGNAGGSVVAACLAAGVPIDRIYRGLLDPADDFFPLDGRTVLRIDVDEWRRMGRTLTVAARHALLRLLPGRGGDDARVQDLVAEHVEGFADSLPAGLFTLSRFERFIADFFLRREVPNTFRGMPRNLRISAQDLDSGERVLFGDPEHDDVPVSLACAASCALPVVFSPVRIGRRHYVDGGLQRTAHLDAAHDAGCDLVVVVSPRVPAGARGESVPTGHGPRASVRDKGMTWVYNQARRISARAQLEFEVAAAPPGTAALVLEPAAEDTILFMQGTATPEARRAMLEYAYRTTKARLAEWLERRPELGERMGWK